MYLVRYMRGTASKLGLTEVDTRNFRFTSRAGIKGKKWLATPLHEIN